MSVGGGPNLSGGISIQQACNAWRLTGNGNANTGPTDYCDPNAGGNCGGGGGGGNGGGSCSNSPGSGGTSPGNGGNSPGNGGPIISPTPTLPPGGILTLGLTGSIPPIPCGVSPGLPTPIPIVASGMTADPLVITNGAVNVSGLPLTCQETGVTLTTTCGSVTFYLDPAVFPSGSSCTFSTPGGIGQNCGDSSTHTYSSGSGLGTVFRGHVTTQSILLTQM